MTPHVTTLAYRVMSTDTVIRVTDPTSMISGQLVMIDGEVLRISPGYPWTGGSSPLGPSYSDPTVVPVLRGQDGTRTSMHPVGATVTSGDAMTAFNVQPGPTLAVAKPGITPWAPVQSLVMTSGTVPLPSAIGYNVFLLTNPVGQNLTLPAPTPDLTGAIVIFVNQGNAGTITVLDADGSISFVQPMEAGVPLAPPVQHSFLAVDWSWCPMGGTPGFQAAPVTSVTAIVGIQNDVPLTSSEGQIDILVLNNNAQLTITGFAGGATGRRLLVQSLGNAAVTIMHNDSRSQPQNRIQTGTNCPIYFAGESGSLQCWYDNVSSAVQGWRTFNVDLGPTVVRAFNSVAQSIPSSTWTLLNFDSHQDDTSGGVIHTLGSSRFVAPVAGRYMATFNGTWVASAGGTVREAYFLLNGVAMVGTGNVLGSGLTVAQTHACSGLAYMQAGDRLEVSVYQDSGAALGIGGSANYSSCAMSFQFIGR